MDNGKAMGPDNISIEVCQLLRKKGISWLIRLFNKVMRSKNEWRSTLNLIYKNSGDIQNCANYRETMPMSYNMKL